MYRHIIILLFVSMPLCAQEARFRRISLEQGLPQSYVNQIIEDGQGFLWLGTQDGAARFDGKRMDVYRQRPGDSTSICGSNVYDFTYAADGYLYASTGNGVSVFDHQRRQWRRYRSAVPPRSMSPRRRVQVHDGTINITYTDRRGRIWVATTQDGLYVTDPASATTYRFMVSSPPDQRLPMNDVWALCEDARGRMWVGLNGGGLMVIDAMRIVRRFRHVPSDPTSLSSDVVRVLYEDAIGTMWIGTHGGGLCQYDPYAHTVPVLRPTAQAIGRTDDFVRAITSRDGSTLTVGLRSGIMQTNVELSRATLLTQWDANVDRIGAARALAYAHDGTLWIGSERSGVGILRPRSTTVQWLQMIDPRRPLRQTVPFIAVADSSHMIVGTDDGVALINTRSLEQQWFDGPPSPDPTNPRVAVSALVRLPSGEYLIGTEYGLFRGRLGATSDKIECPDALVVRPNIDVIRTIVLSDGIAYVATWGGGIRCVDLGTGNERVIDTRIGFPNNTVYAVYCMPNNRLLASTNAGIVVWDNRAQRVERVLTTAHGAQSYEFNSWSHCAIDTGHVAFGGIRGLNVVTMHDLRMPPPPRVLVEVDSFAKDDIRYHIRAIALSTVDPVSYRYRLHDQHAWIQTTSYELLESSLSPGAYDLRVQARYENGEYGQEVIYRFSVPTPAWRSWWAITSGLIMLTAAAWSIATVVTRRRSHRQLEREQLLNQERVRIARDLHDDVGTGLAKIVIMAENTVVEHDQPIIRAIADTAQEVIDSVRSIVWVMKSNDDRLCTTIGYMQAKVTDLFDEKGIVFTYEEILSGDRTLDAITRRNIVLAVKELATNVVRHSQARSVTMYVRDTNHVLTIDVRDDGKGFVVGEHRTGNGLHNIQERMAESGGSVAIETTPGKGTRVVLTIPMQRSAGYTPMSETTK